MASEVAAIPPDVRKVYLRLRRWHSSHVRCVPLPDSLRAAAGELARQHGINRTVKALHLEYGTLKERAEAAGPEKARHNAADSWRTKKIRSLMRSLWMVDAATPS